MDYMSDRSVTGAGGAGSEPAPALPVDESRLAMMRRVRRMPVAERIALLDRLCREQTRIATRARRVR
jgi:hypothetical protein